MIIHLAVYSATDNRRQMNIYFDDRLNRIHSRWITLRCRHADYPRNVKLGIARRL